MKPLKSGLLFVLVLSIIFLFGCRSQEEETPPVAEDIEMLKQAMDEIKDGPEEQSKNDASSESTEKPGELQTGEIIPPKGAENHSFEDQQLVEVKTGVIRVKRAREKMKSELGEAPKKSQESIQLGFSSQIYKPQDSIDVQLMNVVQEDSDRRFTYGFVYLDEYLNPEIEKTLEQTGLQILDVHGEMYTVRISRDEKALRTAMELEYVKWIGYARPEQKTQ